MSAGKSKKIKRAPNALTSALRCTLMSALMCALMSLSFVGCAKNLYVQGRNLAVEGDYVGAADKFSEDVIVNPDRSRSWRELGVAQFELGDFSSSQTNLNRAKVIEDDARTELYLGMVFERLSNWGKATAAYNSALRLDPPDKLIRKIKLRQRRVERRDQIALALESEKEINIDSIPENTIAVYDFDGTGLSEELAPLAIGLAEFTAIDLAKVKALTVVERLRLADLLEELELGQSGLVDRSTAPRVGKLLGSRRIITGWLENPEKDQLRLGGVIVNTVDNTEALPETAEEKLQKLFKMQKVFVYRVLQELGIEPTESERLAIDSLPTRSLEAFLEYSRGIQSVRTGNYAAAEGHFEQAQDLDGGFSEAGEKLQTAQDLSADINFESVVEAMTIFDGSALTNSLQNLNNEISPLPSPTDGGTGNPANQPPVIPTGTVKVRGNPDGD